MSLRGLMNLEIRKQKRKNGFRNEPIKEENYLDKNKFIEYINNHLDFFTWDEESHPDRLIAHSHLVPKETYYRFRTIFQSEDRICVDQTAPAKMTIQFLEILLELAKHCDAKLFKTATKEITKEFIQTEKERLQNKKTTK